MINNLPLWYHNNTLKGEKVMKKRRGGEGGRKKKELLHTFIDLAGGNMQDTSNHGFVDMHS